MKAKLEAHPFFKDFIVHVAVGSAAKMGAEAKRPVDNMLARAAKLGNQTITLTVEKLMTGVTVPQWGSIFVLNDLRRDQGPEGRAEQLDAACHVAALPRATYQG